MNPYRSGRAWLPAAVLSGVFAVTLIVLQLIFHFGYDDRYEPLATDGSVLEWLFRNNLAFWGSGAFDPDETQMVIANVSAGVALIVIGFVLTWLALRGMSPGSSAVPAFFGAWFATLVAAPVASVVGTVIRSIDQEAFPFGPAVDSAAYDTIYGLKWGWLAALLATVVWIGVRPGIGIPGLGGPPVPLPSTEPAPDPDPDPDPDADSYSDTDSDTPPATPPTGTYPQPRT